MRQSLLSPEAKLVFRLVDPACRPDEVAEHVSGVSDWERVLAMATREAIVPVVWRGLRECGAVIPADVAASLRVEAMQRDLSLQRLSHRLQHTVGVFRSRGIPVMLLKGSAFAARFDASLRTRPMADIDLLVHREDVTRGRDAVIEAGWPVTTDEKLHELLKDAHHLPDFVDPQDPRTRLELHVRLMPSDQPFAFDEEAMWGAAVTAPAPFTGAVMPCAEHLLLHASMHFAWQHSMAFGAWKTFRLVSALATSPGLDWTRVAVMARSARACTCVYWTLRLMRRMCGVAVPETALRAVAPPTPERVLAALERHFVASIAVGERPRSPSVKVTRMLWIMALRPQWSGHVSAGRFDPENKWATAYGEASTETRLARYRRHLRNLRSWTEFIRKTLLG